MLFVNPKHVRKNKLAPGGGYENSGVSGDPTKATAALGKVFLQIKIDNALAQIKGLMAGTIQPTHAARQRRRWPGGGGGGRWGGRRRRAARRSARRAARADDGNRAGRHSPSQAPDTVFIDELTWEETRDALKAGKTTVIIPTGGTEKNGYHMVLGKHNYVVTHAANLMARRLEERAGRADDPVRARRQSRYARAPASSRCPRPRTTCCSTPPRAVSRRTASRTSSSSATAAAIRPA